MIGHYDLSPRPQNWTPEDGLLKDCHKVFEEQKSVTSDQPPRLKACLEYVRPRDTLVVTRLGRLARSTLHRCQIVDKTPRPAERKENWSGSWWPAMGFQRPPSMASWTRRLTQPHSCHQISTYCHFPSDGLNVMIGLIRLLFSNPLLDSRWLTWNLRSLILFGWLWH